MSLTSMVWAMNQPVFPSSRRYVLMILGNFASDSGLAYPSIPTICQLTGQDMKTVRGNLQKLVEFGVISDTGKTTGPTGQIRVYKLPPEALPKTDTLDQGREGERWAQGGRKVGVRLPKTVGNPLTSNQEQEHITSKEVTPANKSLNICYHELITAYAREYQRSVGESYVPDKKKDYASARRIHDQGYTPEDITRIAGLAFAMDGFLRDISGSFSGFSSRLNDIKAKSSSRKNGFESKDRHEGLTCPVFTI